MTSVSGVSFTAEQGNQTKKTKPQKREVVYVSSNPNATVNAAGVVAGTSGMVGGAIVGGIAGAVRIPRELCNIAFNSDYGKNIADTIGDFRNGIVNSAELNNLVNAFKGVNAPGTGEGLIHFAATLRENLNVAFNNDKNAKAVIDKVFDPIIYSMTPRNNKKSYLAALLRKCMDPRTVDKMEFYAQQPGVKGTIAKLLGFNVSTSRVIGDIIGNFGQGFSQAILNIKNFKPEEKEAWSKVMNKIADELENNLHLKKYKNIGSALKGLIKNPKWMSEPFAALTEDLKGNVSAIKRTIQSLERKTIYIIAGKTMGIGSAIGAVVFGSLSTLGWFGLKKSLMTKENEKALKAGQI